MSAKAEGTLFQMFRETLLLRDKDNVETSPEWQADRLLEAFIETFGSPEFDEDRCTEPSCHERGHYPTRRLVTPWQPILRKDDHG
jgi:hypothetical protein